jgi:hyperosmotically inducible periplasmic protein
MRTLSILALAWMIASPVVALAQDRDTTGTRASDAALTARVKAALIDDEETKARQIQVETRNGVVQLSGFVDSVMEQEAALKTARLVPGVREVRNDLDLREADRSAEQAANDGVIEARVKAEIAKDGAIGLANDVNVEVDGGIVQLSGFVASLEDKNRARDIASEVGGVKDVRNNIALER